MHFTEKCNTFLEKSMLFLSFFHRLFPWKRGFGAKQAEKTARAWLFFFFVYNFEGALSPYAERNSRENDQKQLPRNGFRLLHRLRRAGDRV